MTKKKQMTNRRFVLTAVIGSLLIMSMVIANSLWASKQTSYATDEAVSAVSSFYLEAIAFRRARIITNLIQSNFDSMEKALSFMKDEGCETQEELRVNLGKVKSLLSLNRFALVDTDDIVYTQYTTYTGRTRHEFLSEGELQGQTISTVSVYGSSKKLCLAIPTPDLSFMGKTFKACFVQLDIEDIVDLIGFDDEGRTYFGLYSKNGVNLSATKLGPVIADRNLFDALREFVPDEVWRQKRYDFSHGKSGSLTFASGGAEETLSYMPIPETDWEMTVLIRESVIQEQIRDISEKNMKTSNNLIFFTMISVLALAVILLLQLRKLSKDQLEEEMEHSRTFQVMANTDALTGIRNKHAYTEKEAILKEQIQKDEIQELALVVCDINGLKTVNDTQGHAAGDQLIKDACAMICDHFSHGAVFRVGGDEFVVILQGKGYDTMQEVIQTFNEKVEANIKENSVVISLGYAVLEEGDVRLRDLFERADQMMYERKKQLKEMGAMTRLL